MLLNKSQFKMFILKRKPILRKGFNFTDFYLHIIRRTLAYNLFKALL